jgi:hypothetical protein
MKEMKFRAWDRATGWWANPKDLQSEIGYNREILYWSAQDGILTLKNHDDYIWIQYTGLKDKNGVEIFEGDILYNELDDAFGDVRWVNAGWSLHWSTGTTWVDTPLYLHMFEAKGNIYENPDLLVAAA